MPTTEHTINDALAEELRLTRHAWRGEKVVRSENTGMLKGSSGRADILVLEPHVSPVVIETEVLPATAVEMEAQDRLGTQVRTTGRTILSAIAIRLPVRLRKSNSSALRPLLKNAQDLEMVLFTGSSPQSWSRWPESGWLAGGVADISALTQSASVPPDVIDEAADFLVEGVKEAAGLLNDIAGTHPGAANRIAEELKQEDAEQTRRMAATIIANAFVFQETLAGGPGQLATVRTIDELRSASGNLNKSAVLAEWRKILEVNYWPIFDIARRILGPVPPGDAKPLLESMASTAGKLLENRLMRSHDLTGAVFQRLIADRKFLAAFYTTPASAALLVGLALSSETTPTGQPWSDSKSINELRIADFACGTGTLLSTVYQKIGQLHELAGGNAESLHSDMMAHVIIGCDVLPAAAHLTASMLSGAHPTSYYEQSSIFTVAYGKQDDGGIALGSLDLLDPQRRFEILEITAKAIEATGERERDTWKTLRQPSFDLVVMNPPFTRATGHEGNKIGVPNPMFAAFSSDAEEQKLMGNAIRELTEGTNVHGNAGEASMFLLLAHRKVRTGGRLALVMPLSLVAGDAWEKSRALIAANYSGLICVSIAGEGGSEMSFSADTGMAECLVICTKGGGPSKRATFITLYSRPASTLQGASAAKQVRELIAGGAIRQLEDGPVGGTPIQFGDDVIGEAIQGPVPSSDGWNLARLADASLGQTAFQMESNQTIWLPSLPQSSIYPVEISTIEKIGKVGPYHSDIDAVNSNGSIRGPFKVEWKRKNSVPTHPALWAHDADRERMIVFDADSEAIPRVGKNKSEQQMIDQKIATIIGTASHLHFNQNFQFNSQSTAMQCTPVRTIGGRAWISIRMNSQDAEHALALWGNTSFGLLLHWWHANKQQAGRGNIGRSALQTLPVLDVTKLKPTALKAAKSLFGQFQSTPLLPMHQLDTDPARHHLDEQFGRLVLGLPKALFAAGGPVDLLRRKLAREPSVCGGK